MTTHQQIDHRSQELRAIVREELSTARDEDRAHQQRLLRAGLVVAVAFFLLYLGVVFLALTAVYVLGELVEPWVGAAVVGSVIVVVAGATTAWALRRVRAVLGDEPPN